jgi:hypothetical protein
MDAVMTTVLGSSVVFCIAILITFVVLIVLKYLRNRKIDKTNTMVWQVLTIPDDKAQLIRKLYDDYANASVGKEAHYLLWREIANIFPETKIGNWKIVFPDAYIVEIRQCP